MPRYFGNDEEHSSESDEEEVEEELIGEESELEDVVQATPSRRKRVEDEDALPGTNLVVETAFDAYFKHNGTRSRTSANVFSSLVPPLTAEEYAEGIESASKGLNIEPLEPSILTESSRDLLFVRFMRELAEGFNLLMYGFGSKRRVLNEFATEYCARFGHVVVANGFQPEFAFKDLLSSIECIPGILDTELQSLYLIIHNIDAAPLRAPKAKSCLALLALNPRIRLVASIDHINAPLLFSTSESTARKPDAHATPPAVPRRGFAWLWHDLTTLAPYDSELAFTDRTSIKGAHGGGPRKKTDGLVAQGTGAMAITETAALHVLASVTQKAKKLFVLIGTRQLESVEDNDLTGAGTEDLQQYGIGYDMLFNIARNDFIATNDTAMRSLLGEFRDHNLVVSAQGTTGSGEILWIPLRKERLASVLKLLQDDT
ncbi:hypothetical protein C0993_001188 [Termitomyces sp. T159_Od127]|nr:hypothetical protein C0993_001188 [Termitomyces sp. T159_Od127]